MESLWMSGSARVSVDVDYRLLSHVKPYNFHLLFIRTFGYLIKNFLETIFRGLSTPKYREISNLTQKLKTG